METWAPIEHSLSEALETPVSINSKHSISGGCINNAYAIETNKRHRFFVKINHASSLGCFQSEALALNEIANTKTIRVPTVIGVGSSNTQAFLILEFILEGNATAKGWELMGENLARMHRTSSEKFGWSEDNVIGTTPQPNNQKETWIDFFREQRLLHQIKLCHSKGFSLNNADLLLEKLDCFFIGYKPSPSLLHGDLWSGNAAFDSKGVPFIFDPCSYYGDRETDIAFTEFFGGFKQEFYLAYNEHWPLHSGYQLRKTLYNLYHCLNHFYLFGGHYGQQAQSMTDDLLSNIR